MPHQCLKCSTEYSDDLMKSMTACLCGASAFLYVPDDTLAESTTLYEIPLDDESRAQGPVVEEEHIITLNVPALLNKKEIIYTHEEGRYTLDVQSMLAGKRPPL